MQGIIRLLSIFTISAVMVAIIGCAEEVDKQKQKQTTLSTPSFQTSLIDCDKPYEYSFSLSPGTVNASITGYHWTFGDNTSGDGATITHAYAGTGDYTVVLQVSDTAGNIASSETNLAVTGCSISGNIQIQNGSAVDNDINDPTAPYQSNDDISNAQAIQNPVVLGGFASAVGSGKNSDRFATSGDTTDVYSVTLAQNQSISLIVSDFNANNPGLNDLDLLLYDANDLTNPVASSTDVVKNESITVPSSGNFFVIVSAAKGISNYLLAIGQLGNNNTLNTGKQLLRLEHDFVVDEIIVRFNPMLPQMNANTFSASAVGVNSGLKALAGNSNGPMLFSLGQGQERIKNLATLGINIQQKSLPNSVSLSDKLQKKYETIKAIKQLRARQDVVSADLNYVRKAFRVPDDTHYSKQWHYPLINLPQAWDLTTGAPATGDVIVAVVDTGVVLSHPDITNKLVPGFDFIRSDANAADGEPGIDNNPDDPGDGSTPGTSSFHGTHVSGTIGAETNNASGVAGVSWDAKIMPIRVLGRQGGSSFDVLQGVRYAAGLSNNSNTVPAQRADIINLSLGGGGYSQTEQDVFREVRNAGVIVVAAAGNDGNDILNYPASYAGVVSVSAVELRKQLAPYSNFGTEIDVAAPGGDSRVDRNADGYRDSVLSTAADDSGGSRVPVYRFYQGTSMAAPHISGVIALMKAVHPALDPDVFDNLLISGAITEDLAGNGATTRDNSFGYGLIDAQKAVQEAMSLQTGNQLPGVLSVAPGFLNFENFLTEMMITTANSGELPINVVSVTDDANWLTVVPLTVDTNNLGTYRATVNRSGLSNGIYTAKISFTTDIPNTIDVPVTMLVGSLGTRPDDVGKLWVLLIDVDKNNTLPPVEAQRTQSDQYTYTINEVGTGNYSVMAGTDLDNDDLVCDAGEACGANPTLGQMSIINVSTTSISDVNFTAGFDLLFNINNLLNAQGENGILPYSRTVSIKRIAGQ